jgi:hypothetical protein
MEKLRKCPMIYTGRASRTESYKVEVASCRSVEKKISLHDRFPMPSKGLSIVTELPM